MPSILKELNKLNVSMQGKSGDIFFNGKTTTMNKKLIILTENVKSGYFSNFPCLEIFFFKHVIGKTRIQN